MVVNYCDRERISVTYCVLQIFFCHLYLSLLIFYMNKAAIRNIFVRAEGK